MTDDLFGWTPPPPAPKARAPRKPKAPAGSPYLPGLATRSDSAACRRFIAARLLMYREGWAAYAAQRDAARLAPLNAARAELLWALRLLEGRHPDSPRGLQWVQVGTTGAAVGERVQVLAWRPGPMGVRIRTAKYLSGFFTSPAKVLGAVRPAD